MRQVPVQADVDERWLFLKRAGSLVFLTALILPSPMVHLTHVPLTSILWQQTP